MAERMIEAAGATVCAEAFGDPGDPPVLLIAGMSGSMLSWDAEFCRSLARRGRFVIRYDHRDTGRSTTDPPGQPSYRSEDLVADAAAVLDGFGVPSAHVVGTSMGGALAQLFALDHPDRVRSLTLISTTFAVPHAHELPGIAPELGTFFAEATVDWSDRSGAVEYLVEYLRVLSGGGRSFDEDAARALAQREMERTGNVASAQNHGLLEGDERQLGSLSRIRVPVLVIHGTADPLFPLPHGAALADAFADGGLLTLADAGHGLERVDWPVVIDALERHTV